MMNLVKDERGSFFVFGPLWFVILVIILSFIFGAMRNNSNNSSYRNSSSYQTGRSIDSIQSPTNNSNGLLLYNGVQCLNCLTINPHYAYILSNCGMRID